MKFGFNHITEDARDKLTELGVRWAHETESYMSIWTDTYDEIQQERADKDDQVVDDREDMRRRYQSQGTRMVKWEDGRYFYLIRDTVFVQEKKHFTDNRATTPTVHEVSVLDVLPKEEQDTWRQRLIRKDLAVNLPMI